MRGDAYEGCCLGQILTECNAGGPRLAWGRCQRGLRASQCPSEGWAHTRGSPLPSAPPSPQSSPPGQLGQPHVAAISELPLPRAKFHRLRGGLEHGPNPPFPWAIFFEGITGRQSEGNRQCQRCSQHSPWEPHADHAKWRQGIQLRSRTRSGTWWPGRAVSAGLRRAVQGCAPLNRVVRGNAEFALALIRSALENTGCC